MRFFKSTRLITLLLAALLLALSAPAGALADGKDVIRDCAQDGDLDGNYSDEELDDAYSNLPSDIDEYSDCRDVIKQAQAGGKGGEEAGDSPRDSSGDGGAGADENLSGEDTDGGGGTASDQGELDRREQDSRNGKEPETAVDPSADSTDADEDDGGLPTAALVAIILLVLSAIAGGVYMVRDRLPGSGPDQRP